MTDRGTTAPEHHIPPAGENPAPRATDTAWVRDERPPAAPDQEYPQIVEAPRHIENVCPECGRPR